jgi:hypothetical protein
MQIQSYMIRAWAAFADDPGVNGLTKEIGWPTYNSGEATLGRLGFNNSPCLDLALPSAEIQLTTCGVHGPGVADATLN